MLKLNYFSGETFDCIAFSSFKDIFFVTEVFKDVLLIEIPTLSTVALTSLLLGETVTYSYDEAQTGKLNYNDCKNQPNNFCTRNRRHFHADGQPISKRAAITRYTQLIAIPFQAKLFCLFRL